MSEPLDPPPPPAVARRLPADDDDRPRRRPPLVGRKPAGVLPRGLVRKTSFTVIALSMLGAAVVCILAIWDYAQRDVAWKAVSTLGVVGLFMLAFTVLNELFAPNEPAGRD